MANNLFREKVIQEKDKKRYLLQSHIKKSFKKEV